MSKYARIVFDLVNNENYIYYKLIINGKCQIDEFIEKVEKSVRDKKSLLRIIALMDSLGAKKLPSTQFNHIHISSRNVFEFKKDALRVYILKGEEEVTIILGGYKNTQKKDIDRVDRIVKYYSENKQ